ncbi:Ldh family oxidoreductase [Ornithinimicrobium murale]|uniref:Ldh family oxidoreductase n=1 Tax=Ornithinimicrobium murale TaxID=1050153 RepID=UPI003B506D95
MGLNAEDCIPWTRLCEHVRAALDDDGPDAQLASEALVEAEALGQSHFGIGLLQRWRAAEGETRKPSAESQSGQLHHWDVEGLFGPLVLARASRVAAREARGSGMAAVVLHGLGGSGRLAPFAQAIATQGLVGAVFAASPPLVAAHGGSKPLWGTNPFALAVPGHNTPLVVDASTASLTAAALAEARSSGHDLPEGAAVTTRGEPTRDPTDVAALLPRGGLLGTLAAVLVESLTSGLAGQSATSGWRSATVMACEARAPIAEVMRDRIEAADAREPGSGTREALMHARRHGVPLSPAVGSFLGLT